MVDDKATRADLLARNAHPGAGDILDSLLAQGFIETDQIAAPVAGPTPPAASAPFVGAAPAAPTDGQAPVEVSLAEASRFARRSLVTYLGPSADDLTALIEKSRGAAELATVLEKCRQIIQSLAGKKKAEDFWAGVSARMPKA